MRLIIFSATNLPVPRVHGLFAVGLVFLRGEGDLVVGDLREILLTSLDHRGYRGEACADLQLSRAERRGALNRFAEVQAVAVRIGRCRYAVVRQEHLLVVVLTVIFWLRQCAGYEIDTSGVTYICHIVAWAETSHDCVIKNHL